LGDVVKFAAEEGISPLEYVRRINEQGPQPTGKSREDVESDLTDIDAPVKKKKVLTLKIKTPEKKKATSASKTAVKIAPKGAKGKDAKNTKDAAKKDTKKGGKEVKKEIKEVKVKKEPEEKPVDPPLFNMVNAKLSYDDVEHRLYVSQQLSSSETNASSESLSIASVDFSASPTVRSPILMTLTTLSTRRLCDRWPVGCWTLSSRTPASPLVLMRKPSRSSLTSVRSYAIMPISPASPKCTRRSPSLLA
jgi:hypothetical protein